MQFILTCKSADLGAGVAIAAEFSWDGCTLNWEEIEINYGIDESSIHSITISCYPIQKFIETAAPFKHLPYSSYSSLDIDLQLENLEKIGVLLTRKPSDLGSFHINERWYASYKDGNLFKGSNKDEIDS